jgi:hypothetical protein
MTRKPGRLTSARLKDRNATNDRQSLAALGPQARELTEAELDCVSGGSANGIAALLAVKAEAKRPATQG